MSLAVALLLSPTDYALASDTRSFAGPGMHHEVAKAHRIGSWLVAFAGGIVGGQRMIRALRKGGTLGTALDRDAVEASISAAFEKVVLDCGPCNPGAYPSVGVDLLLVGPAGILAMAPEGTTHWVSSPWWAIGCGDGYAMGWLDQITVTRARDAVSSLLADEADSGFGHPPRIEVSDLKSCIQAAGWRYPGIGGEVMVLRGPA